MDCAVSNRTPVQTPVATGIGILPFFPNQHVAGQAMPRQNNTQDKLPSAVGLTDGTGAGSQPYLQNLTNVPAGGLRVGHLTQESQTKSTDTGSGVRKQCHAVVFQYCNSLCICWEITFCNVFITVPF